jgi:hypothetical protein
LKCSHSLVDRENSVWLDNLCPICLWRKNKLYKEFIEKIVNADPLWQDEWDKIKHNKLVKYQEKK